MTEGGSFMTREILIIRLSSIGDVIHCTPVAGSLKAAWPDCRITWLVGETCADLIKDNPHIDEIMVWPRERFDKHLREYEFSQALALWRDLRQQLAVKSFYAVLDIHGLFLTGMIARLVRTDRRIGLKCARELNPLFMTEKAAPLGTHIIDRYLGVLTALGIRPACREMLLMVPGEAREFAQHFLQQAQVAAEDRLAVLVPGTTWPTKNWPAERFAATAARLAQDFKILLCGGKSELALGREIVAKAGVPVINAIGQTSLLEMAAILGCAAVVIAGDTGPLYMAAALGTPTVAIFGPTNPATYVPPGKNNAFVYNQQACSFCHKTKCRLKSMDCISSVQPAAVVEQVYRVGKKS
ncbi:glycosyltransferase family 9 protein [Sporomusa sphaeroides]|nr:glycosyltransferase family 9 protein [Sporomusa sphaeroides]